MKHLRHICVWSGIGLALVILVIIYPTSVGTKKFLIPTEEDAYVSGSEGNKELALGSLVPTLLISGYNQGEFVPYLKFNLETIPKSDNTVNVDVDSAELRMLLSSATGNQTKLFITANSCDKNNWSSTNLTYNNRPCPTTLKGVDSIVVNASGLPQVSMWDVSNTIMNAAKHDQEKITFAITTVPLLKGRDISEIIANTQRTNESVVQFWSANESAKSGTAMPTLIVNTVTTPKPIITYLSTTIAVVLPILGILLTLIPPGQTKK